MWVGHHSYLLSCEVFEDYFSSSSEMQYACIWTKIRVNNFHNFSWWDQSMTFPSDKLSISSTILSDRSGQDSTEWRAVQQSSPKRWAPNVDCERSNGNPTLIHVSNLPPGRHRLRFGGMLVLIRRLMASRVTVDCVDEWRVIWMKYGYQNRFKTESVERKVAQPTSL